MDQDTGSQDPRQPSRRVVLRGAALGGVAVPLLAACGGEEATGEVGSGSGDTGSSPDGPTGNGGSEMSVATSEVPVGGGTVLKDQEVVVTQPADGEFKGFSAVCTHKGCIVDSVADGTINCPCHGSRFSVEDGSVVAGPAEQPLASKTVSVEGDQIKIS